MTGENERPGVVPEWLLERLAAGDLSAARAAALRGRLAVEPGGLARLKRISDSNDDILAAHPPGGIVAAIVDRAGGSQHSAAARPAIERTRTRNWTFALGAPTVVLAVVALTVWSRPRPPAGLVDNSAGGVATGGDIDRIKGLRPSLRVYRKVGDTVERLQDGATAHAGDQLQLAYVTAGRRYGALVSVDGAGHVTFHLPPSAGPAARLRSGGEVALAEAYELDTAPGFERFLFVSGNDPFDASLLSDVVRGTAPTPLGTFGVALTLRKE